MTRSDLRTLVLSWLDDPQGAYFTTTVVNTWLNMAQREVQKLLLQASENYYMKPVETLTVASQADYVLPTDFMVEHRLELVVSGTGATENRQALMPITTNQQDLVSIQLGNPTAYYIKKDRVTLSPTPQTSNLTLRLYYSPRVADMTSDSDSPDVPEQYMEYVAILAAYDGFIKDDRDPGHLIHKKEKYEQLLKQMSEDRNQDFSRQVVSTSEWDYGGVY